MAGPLISPIRPDQIPSAARVMANAFANAPRYTSLLPNDVQRQARLPWVWEQPSALASIPAEPCTSPMVDPVMPCWASLSGVHPKNPSTQCSDAVAVRPLGCARPARHPGLAATASSCPHTRRAQTAWPVLVPQRHRCRSLGAAHRFRKRPHQPDASAHR